MEPRCTTERDLGEDSEVQNLRGTRSQELSLHNAESEHLLISCALGPPLPHPRPSLGIPSPLIPELMVSSC